MEPHEELFPFPVIEGYRTLRQLDEGSNSTVWVIVDDATGEELAVKILRAEAAGGAAEAEALCLNHEFLVETFGVVASSRGPGILMEYCPAGSVAQLVAIRGPLGLGETITVIAPIATALAYLHGQGLTHGDLSPRNILFTAEGKPKLGDFGTHRMVGQSPGNHGTQGFCAPETGDQEASGALAPARDVYALAACAWYLLTGRPPNATANRVPLGSMVPEVNDELAMLLEQSLAQDPENRPSAEQFGQRLFVGGQPLPVELGAAVEHDALKHMLTTMQTPTSAGFLGGRLRRGAPNHADKELLRERKAQIKAQQKPVPRRLRQAFDNHAADAARSGQDGGERGWALQHRIHGLKHGSRRIVVALAAGLLFVALAAGGSAFVKGNGDSATAGGPRGPAEVQMGAPEVKGAPATRPSRASNHELMLVAADLAIRRDKGLMDGNPGVLREVHAPGSPSLEVDRQVLAGMKELGLHLEGLDTRLDDVSVLRVDEPGRALLEAESVQGGYRYVDAKGKTVVIARESERRRVRMELRFIGATWRLWRVSDAS